MLTQIAKVRRVAAASILAVSIWSGTARAQVLEQVPANAAAVVKIKNLEATNAKVAKMAKAFGLDEFVPQAKDPLGALLEKANITKGIDKTGDAALVLFAPAGGDGEPIAEAIVPVSDYDAFVSNFVKTDNADGGDITAVKDPENPLKRMFIAHHGKYALLSDKKEHLDAKGSLKLSPGAAKESESKDLIFLLNMPVLREMALPQIKQHRGEWIKQIDAGMAGEEMLKKYNPVVDTIVNAVLDKAEEFLQDADAVVFSVNLTDVGIVGGAMVEFAPDSKLGKAMTHLKGGKGPMLAGLPDQQYFIFGGSSCDPKEIGPVADEWLSPIIRDLNNTHGEAAKEIAGLLEGAKTLVSATDHSSMGWLVPTKPIGQESLFQTVTVSYGDSKAIVAAQKNMLTSVNDLMSALPNGGPKTKIEFTDPKNVDGVELQSYATKLNFDKNDPVGIQAQGMLTMLYGPNGMTGNFGSIDDKTFIAVQGVSDDFLKEAIKSAKEGKDVMSQNAGVKAVASEIAPNRSFVYYVELDNIVNTVVRYAQGFGLPIKMKVPQNLPPLAISAGVDGPTIRADIVIPTQTVQSMISAGIQAFMQQGGGGGGL